MNVSGSGGDLSYWRTPSGSEVDFIWKRGKEAIGLEVKSSDRWRSEFGYALKELHSEKAVHRFRCLLWDGAP